MIRRFLFATLIVAATSIATTSAAEIVEFRDGRFMQIATHRVHGEWIELDLGPKGRIVIPVTRVESIVREGRKLRASDLLSAPDPNGKRRELVSDESVEARAEARARRS